MSAPSRRANRWYSATRARDAWVCARRRACARSAAPPRRETAGYLIGAVVQLIVGPIWIYQGAKGPGMNLTMVLGILLLILGARSALLYLKQRREQKTTPA